MALRSNCDFKAIRLFCPMLGLQRCFWHAWYQCSGWECIRTAMTQQLTFGWERSSIHFTFKAESVKFTLSKAQPSLEIHKSLNFVMQFSNQRRFTKICTLGESVQALLMFLL